MTHNFSLTLKFSTKQTKQKHQNMEKKKRTKIPMRPGKDSKF